MTSPTNTTITDPTLQFSWDSVDGATSYQLHVDNDTTFNDSIIFKTTDATSDISNTLADGRYYWRVRCQDNQDKWGVWSDVWSFEVDATSHSIQLSLSDLSLVFGVVPVGQTRDTLLTIENLSTSSDTLTGNVSISGNGFFIISGAGSYDRSPGESRNVTIRFTPNSNQNYSGNLQITHNATNASSPIDVPLFGTGQDAGPVTFYQFNGNANDESGNSNHGTLLGNAAADGFLSVGDNAQDALSLPHNILNGATDFTISSALKINILHTGAGFPAPWNTWFGAGHSSFVDALQLYYSGNENAWMGSLDEPINFDSNTMEDGNWHHVIFMRDDNLARLFVDGEEIGTGVAVETNPLSIDPGGFIIGQDQDNIGGSFAQNQSWAGYIDNVRVYRRTLNPDEIQEIYLTDQGPSTVWSDGFESYAPGSFPSSSWTPDANADASYIDDTIFLEGTKSLRHVGELGGCWAAIAYKPLTVSPPFEIEFAVRNGDESLSGCHPKRAAVGIRKGVTWTNPARRLITFDADGTIVGSSGTTLGTYSTLTWYIVNIRYERPSASEVTLTYWINGTYLGSETVEARAEEDELTNLNLAVEEGTAWFDAIRISH